ncbi:hypothetical protein PPL_08019 [Heterostelium album PN500]|uniref:Uncharacterized protein n=1 Tax=Heterostelium pallidum (strain ATCC 26659 / Pp 5 / PN500) TaxID=670386 RepID=D3BHL6_HETP5|nr:hypothetical protein PPL_08019 [Heterostelium album PN500]EFA79193.1 hypothetical protein PPL_08019 [Heterostelium album PN500]|eukprot:XP_020431314.1 hypothetical protein PPL_08019 [Heterostelium album PN500]
MSSNKIIKIQKQLTFNPSLLLLLNRNRYRLCNQNLYYSTTTTTSATQYYSKEERRGGSIDYLKIPTPLPKPPHSDPHPQEPRDSNPQAPRPPSERFPSPFPKPQRKERPDSRPEDGYPNPSPI